MQIRLATEQDKKSIWNIFQAVIQPGDTHVFREDTTEAEFEFWLNNNLCVYVAEQEDKILGFYNLKKNQVDRGSHIANAGYMVHPTAYGQGIGSALCKHSLSQAKARGFRAMQFNLVISTNARAIHVWKKHGFEIIGRIPEAFDHKEKGLVDALLLYQKL